LLGAFGLAGAGWAGTGGASTGGGASPALAPSSTGSRSVTSLMNALYETALPEGK
jgi:hypothetical protein